jgi:hypothetical protein
MKNKNFKINKEDMDIQLSTKISPLVLLDDIVEKLGPQKTVLMLSYICLQKADPYVTSMLGVLATKKNLEEAEAMLILRYVADNWKSMAKNKKISCHFSKWYKKARAGAKTGELQERNDSRRL